MREHEHKTGESQKMPLQVLAAAFSFGETFYVMIIEKVYCERKEYKMRKLKYDDIPDYSAYSLQDLYDVKQHIDREIFPDRYELIIQEITRKEEAVQPRDKSAPVSIVAVITGFLIGGFLGLIGGGVLGIGAFFLIIETGSAAAKSNLDGATGMGAIIDISAIIGALIGAFKGAKRAWK